MLVMCVSDTNSLLGAGRSAESVVPTDGMTVNMLKSYQESDICGKNDQQLQQAMEHVCEKEHRGGRERNSPAAYATNCLWQVLSSGLIRKHMHIHVYHVLFQMCIVGIRSAITIVRDPLSFFLLVSICCSSPYHPLPFLPQLLKLVILSLLVGTVYFKQDNKHHSENTLFNVITDRSAHGSLL